MINKKFPDLLILGNLDAVLTAAASAILRIFKHHLCPLYSSTRGHTIFYTNVFIKTMTLDKENINTFCRASKNVILLRMLNFAASGSWKWIASLVRGKEASTMSSLDANISFLVHPEKMEKQTLISRLYFPSPCILLFALWKKNS